jgi:hypothetical protein
MASTRLYGPTLPPGAAGSIALNTPGAGATPNALPITQSITSASDAMIETPGLTGVPLAVSIPPNSPLEGKPFELTFSGVIENAQSSTFTVKVWGLKTALSNTPASNTALGSSGAISAFTGKTNWYATAKMLLDSISGTLTGKLEFFVNNSLVAAVALSTVITGINNVPVTSPPATTPTGVPILNFGISVASGTVTAANTVVLDDAGINF